MKVSGVFLCQSGGWRIVSSILYKAFSEDEDLRSLKSFKKEEFPDFFSLVSEFFMKSGNFYSWIYWDQEAPVGALLAIPFNWRATPVYFLHFVRKLWKLIKWRAFSAALVILKSAWFSRPSKPCLRVIF